VTQPAQRPQVDPRQLMIVVAERIVGNILMQALGASLEPCICGCVLGYRVDFPHAIHLTRQGPEIFDPRAKRASGDAGAAGHSGPSTSPLGVLPTTPAGGPEEAGTTPIIITGGK
jgi:hypothetical protein